MATKIKLRRWDVVDYLQTEEEIAAYLEAVTEENERELMAVALGDVTRARNMSQLAREVGMTREGLYKPLPSEGNPSFAAIMKVAKALVLQLGFLPVRRASADRKVRRQARRALTDASGASR